MPRCSHAAPAQRRHACKPSKWRRRESNPRDVPTWRSRILRNLRCRGRASRRLTERRTGARPGAWALTPKHAAEGLGRVATGSVLPLSWRSPRSANSIPEPATRSLTVDETRISPALALAAMRAPMCTARPASSPSSRSHSPVSDTARNAKPERVCVGDDRLRACNRSRWPVEGGKETVAGRVHLLAPKATELRPDGVSVPAEQVAPRLVAERERLLCEPTRSVNRIVASTRSGTGRAGACRKRSTSAVTWCRSRWAVEGPRARRRGRRESQPRFVAPQPRAREPREGLGLQLAIEHSVRNANAGKMPRYDRVGHGPPELSRGARARGWPAWRPSAPP